MAGNLLLAFDNPDALYLIRRYADECGFQTLAAKASAEICTAAQKVNPQAIILEVQDGPAGLTVLRALKAEESTRHIPVIVCCDRDNDLAGCSDVAASLCQPVLYSDFMDALCRAGILPGAANQLSEQQGTHVIRSGPAASQHEATKVRWSSQMADAVMARSPFLSEDWRYESGVMLSALWHLWLRSKDARYFDFIKANIDAFVTPDGCIRTYCIEEYNLDQINEGKLLFPLYANTGDDRYKKAAYLLREQLQKHPRTSENGFWHKLIYPHQMWLDGIYMAGPFYADFARVFDEPAAYHDVTHQIFLIDEHTRDDKTGLLYHGWDESKSQIWADPVTGCSPNFWGRAIGWYVMALVDVLDILPRDHPQRRKVIAILQKTVSALAAVQDPSTGTWYQVLDQGGRQGNYLEASASCMFVYAITRGIRKGHIDKKYLEIARKGYAGILAEFVTVDAQGQPHLNGICSVAGLDQNRDGSFEYYISEKVVADDYKGVGPFIMASIEIEHLANGLAR